MSGDMRRPEWLKKAKPINPAVLARKASIAHLGLHTVCESARCPNLSECYESGNATFLIMGESCTRNCAFCAVDHGGAGELDPDEGRKIARYMQGMGIRYAVITSVTRDDLPDGGAGHFERVVQDIRAVLPDVGLELLVPDFRGDREAVERVVRLPIHVFGHNLETVEGLYATVRAGADYRRSLEVLRIAAEARSAGASGTRLQVKSGTRMRIKTGIRVRIKTGIRVRIKTGIRVRIKTGIRVRIKTGIRVRIKTGIMVGLGETDGQLEALFADAARAGVEILTIGQYLRPSWDNLPVARYCEPAHFDRLAESARAHGIAVVQAGPYVRSSYLAESVFRGGEEINLTTP